MRKRSTMGRAGALWTLALAAATCGGRADTWDGSTAIDPLCQTAPTQCGGLIGGLCAVEDDCDDGVCCLSNDCGGGMCTYLCGRNAHCPPGMGCHDGFCFFRCSVDGDCGPGQRCEQGRTLCQYR